MSRNMFNDRTGITEYKAGNGRTVLKLFDTETGEIFTDSKYQVIPFTPVSPLPRFAKSEEQALDFRSVNHLRFTTNNNVWFGELEKLEQIHGQDILKQFLSLTKKVKVHNVLFISREELCSMFESSNSNLNRKLNSLEKRNLIKYTTKNLTVPKTIKVLLNPSHFWYGCNSSRLNEWLGYWCPKSSKVAEEGKGFKHSEDISLTGIVYSEDDFPQSYDVMYDIGVYDDRRESIGDKSFVEGSSYLTHQDLIYIVYGVG